MQRALGLLLILLSLAGCERPPEASRQMENYLDRLARVLDQSWTPWDANQLSQYRMPDRRSRLIDIPEIRVGLLDLLVESRRCQTLQQLVSERNSSLGRLMPASHLLAFEGEVLRAIDACLVVIAEDDSRTALKAQLEQIAQAKRASLPATFWNALNGSTEFEQYLRFADVPLPRSEHALTDHEAQRALQSLASIGQALPDELPPERASLEPLFHDLHRSERGGQLIHSLMRLSHTMEQAAAMLRARPANFLCPLGAPTERSRILLNVFTTFYARQIQPQMAQAQRLGLAWQAALVELSTVPEIPPLTEEYLDALAGTERGLWQRYQRALATHTEAWQDVLGACQQGPGQSAWEAARDEG